MLRQNQGRIQTTKEPGERKSVCAARSSNRANDNHIPGTLGDASVEESREPEILWPTSAISMVARVSFSPYSASFTTPFFNRLTHATLGMHPELSEAFHCRSSIARPKTGFLWEKRVRLSRRKISCLRYKTKIIEKTHEVQTTLG